MAERLVNVDRDTHPDHGAICTFRRENASVVKEAFVKLLRQVESRDAQ
jgi:hypothetical protein